MSLDQSFWFKRLGLELLLIFLFIFLPPAPSSVSPGPEAVDHGLGPTPNLHHRHIQHYRGVGHGCVERDSPQDRIWLQPDRPRLPWPQLLGQRLDGTVGSGGRRGQPERLTCSRAARQKNNDPRCSAFTQRVGILHGGPRRSSLPPHSHKEKYPAEMMAQEERTLNKWHGDDQYLDL